MLLLLFLLGLNLLLLRIVKMHHYIWAWFIISWYICTIIFIGYRSLSFLQKFLSILRRSLKLFILFLLLLLLLYLHQHLFSRNRADKTIIFKVTFFHSSIRKNHLSIPMLDSLNPLANIFTSIGPYHFSMPFSLIILILTFIDISWCPLKFTLTTLFVI